MIQGLSNRALEPGDEAFIYSTWLRGLYFGNAWFRQISKVDYFDKYRAVIKHLLANATVRIVCIEDAPDVIVGYAVHSADGTTLHWVYVKKAWRKQGIGKGLIPPNVTIITHLTEKAAEKKLDSWKFDPLLT